MSLFVQQSPNRGFDADVELATIPKAHQHMYTHEDRLILLNTPASSSGADVQPEPAEEDYVLDASDLLQQALEKKDGQRTVMMPVEDTPLCKYTAKWALDNFLNSTDKVVLVHVRPFPQAVLNGEHGSVDLFNAIDKLEKGERDRAAQILRKYAKLLRETVSASGVVVEDIVGFAIRGRDPRDLLVEKATEVKADTIVMGARSGRSPVAKAMLGSVTSYLTNHVACPVVVVRDPAQEAEAKRAQHKTHPNPTRGGGGQGIAIGFKDPTIMRQTIG
ncbi:hypothetical protein BCR44DRAFT_44674 [Catenaria anguillulae PL171]|uniref:UspA domain-containing protein n=1 Tax=Catenaria anguillulae PL171 TaxID=765915 RepID=A0A1Y2HRV5_9FUNG|nr:hypothetical protein BCR44DRAFT_44674 [Catenaria anguillulae PL171]